MEQSAVRNPWSKMTIRSDMLADSQERDSEERNRWRRTDRRTVRGGRSSIRLVVSSSLREPANRSGKALVSLAALLRGAVNAVMHDDNALVFSTSIESRSAGRELTIS
jgi:hypothetical protein